MFDPYQINNSSLSFLSAYMGEEPDDLDYEAVNVIEKYTIAEFAEIATYDSIVAGWSKRRSKRGKTRQSTFLCIFL